MSVADAARSRAGAVAALLAVVAATLLPLLADAPLAAAQTPWQEVDLELRITARGHLDGRIEVGLQVRSDDGDWGPRLLPITRLIPAGEGQTRWLASSPVPLDGTEVRLAARRLDDGSVSVALRTRNAGRFWSDRLVPEHHRLAVLAHPGAWMSSSELTLEAGLPQIVSFYGYPEVPAMGVLGHGDPAQVAAEITEWTRRYDALNGSRGVVGAYHLITGVAQANPTSNGLWLGRLSHDRIAQYVEAARRHGLLLFLDNQIGWSDPLREVQMLEEFLKEPFVHMAIDPEFATEPLGVRPGRAIGGITGAQVNEVLLYLSELVQTEGLPTKILMVHQFTGRMLHDREQIQTQPGVELSIDMDGFGTPEAKINGYRLYALREPSQLPAFKLFFNQDTPVMTPQEVLALDPQPDLIMYQ